MAKKKVSTTTKKVKKTDDTQVEEPVEVVSSEDDYAPTDVEAAYWEEKVKKTAVKSLPKKSAKDVEDYISNIMVVAKPNESSEQLLRRFNREVRDLNLMDDIRERLEYEKPSQKRKRLKREKYLASKQRRYWE